jgi:hypothetical protein
MSKKSFKILATREGSDQGQKMEVLGPDGAPCGEYMIIRGVDASAYRNAQRLFRRAIIKFREEKGSASIESEEYQLFIETEQKKMTSALVASWSFSEDCTPESVLQLFTEAPYVADQVDTFAGKRERFAGSWPKPSEPTQKEKSASVSH